MKLFKNIFRRKEQTSPAPESYFGIEYFETEVGGYLDRLDEMLSAGEFDRVSEAERRGMEVALRFAQDAYEAAMSAPDAAEAIDRFLGYIKANARVLKDDPMAGALIRHMADEIIDSYQADLAEEIERRQIRAQLTPEQIQWAAAEVDARCDDFMRHLYQGDAEAAVAELLKAEYVAENYLPESHPSSIEVKNNTGSFFLFDCQYEKAEEPLRIAWQLVEPQLDTAPDLGMAVLTNYAVALGHLGRTNEAIGLQRRLVELRRTYNGPRSEPYAQALNNTAMVLRDLGDLDEALLLSREAVEIRGEQDPVDPEKLATALNNLALLGMEAENVGEADQALRRAVDLARTGRVGAETEAISWLIRGQLATRLLRLEEAQSYLENAERIATESLSPHHPIHAKIEGAWSVHAHFNEDSELELEASARALERVKSQQGVALEAWVDAHQVHVQGLLYAKRPAEAVPILGEALRAYPDGGGKALDFLRYLQVLSLGMSGRFAQAEEYARRRLERGGLIVEHECLLRKAQGWNLFHLERHRDALEAFKRSAALETASLKSRARDALLMLATLWRESDGELTADDFRFAYACLLSLKEDAPLRPLSEIDRIVQAVPDDATLIEYVRVRNELFLQPEALLGEYPDEYYLILTVRGGRIHLERSRARDLDDADREITDYRGALLGRDEAEARAAGVRGVLNLHVFGGMEEFKSQEEVREFSLPIKSARIHSSLVSPAHDAVQGARRLLISPVGDICRVPFEALRCFQGSGGDYLGERFAILYVTAESLLSNPEPTMRVDLSSAVVIGDPDFDAVLSPQGESRLLPPIMDEFSPLPASRAESELIAEVCGVRPWLGAEATKAALLSARSPSILHLATHAFQIDRQFHVREEVPSWLVGTWESPAEDGVVYSGIAFSGANGPEIDGRSTVDLAGLLQPEEVEGLDLRDTALVVLSGCETGLGNVSENERMKGFAEAFLRAAARAVVCSLWPVPDTSTRIYMQEMYGRLAAGDRLSDAMRAARSKVRAVAEDPLHWGGFVAYGTDLRFELCHA